MDLIVKRTPMPAARFMASRTSAMTDICTTWVTRRLATAKTLPPTPSRKLPRQADTSEVEILTLRYSVGVMPPRALWGRCSL